jgi:cytochrome c oxidase subunit II
MRRLLQMIVLGVLVAAGAFAYCKFRIPPGANAVVTVNPLQAAMELATERGCKACHSFDGTVGVGPSWLGTYGSQRSFQDGSVLLADEAYLIESMQQPAAKVVVGFQNVMAPVALSEQDMTTLIGLIRGLGQAPAP